MLASLRTLRVRLEPQIGRDSSRSVLCMDWVLSLRSTKSDTDTFNGMAPVVTESAEPLLAPDSHSNRGFVPHFDASRNGLLQ